MLQFDINFIFIFLHRWSNVMFSQSIRNHCSGTISFKIFKGSSHVSNCRFSYKTFYHLKYFELLKHFFTKSPQTMYYNKNILSR